jgi:hypothetical protein
MQVLLDRVAELELQVEDLTYKNEQYEIIINERAGRPVEAVKTYRNENYIDEESASIDASPSEPNEVGEQEQPSADEPVASQIEPINEMPPTDMLKTSASTDRGTDKLRVMAESRSSTPSHVLSIDTERRIGKN